LASTQLARTGAPIKEAITIAVVNAAGILVMESIVETKAATIVQFIEGLRGERF